MNSVERVRAICKERKIPLHRLERDCGFGNGYISQLKKGALPDDRLYKIASYLNVDPYFLLFGDKNLPKVMDGYSALAESITVDNIIPATDGDGQLTTDSVILSDKDLRLVEWFRSLPQEKQKAILISQDAPEDLL